VGVGLSEVMREPLTGDEEVDEMGVSEQWI
jgi:hypothetical protein